MRYPMLQIFALVGLAWPLPLLAVESVTRAPGNAVERHMPGSSELTPWVHDPQLLGESTADALATLEVAVPQANTVKLKGVVPAIRFESGVANIPASTVRELQAVLASLRDRANVRLHLVGHADNQPLSPSLARVYGDNAGLSKERAGEVAEFFYDALVLDPESISFEWVGDTEPVASNESAAGRAQNRRVEVEVWYDEIEEQAGQQEIVVASDVKRVKVCRVQTLCKLRYINGHDKRARIQNVIAPLHYSSESAQVDAAFVERVKRAWMNLQDRRNVVIKFIGHSDDAALDERSERIYGSHENQSKARAWRVALAVREQLGLDSGAVDADGLGTQRPLSSNDTTAGRALNRRVEVEFWYDDPLQELADEPQLCPGEPPTELVTRVYDPPWGVLEPLMLHSGQAQIPAGFTEKLQRAMADIAGRDGARLRFVGYTENLTLDRRTAAIYGDDVGLATARARRAAETVTQMMALEPDQVEFEGRGYVHADDVVNAGFIQGATSHVVVQAVYDEAAVFDELDALQIQPLKQELETENPFALNLMRITVDGEPVDDAGRSSADVQRCTDVALDDADIRFGFDNLSAVRRLSVDAYPDRVALDAEHGTLADAVRFRLHSNYRPFIERSEIRIFNQGDSTQALPLAVLEMDEQGFAQWQPEADEVELRPGQLQYLVRAYGKDGNFDETRVHALQLTLADSGDADDAEMLDSKAAHDKVMQQRLLAGYGNDSLALTNIALGSGTVRVQGSGIPEGHSVWVAGQAVPTDADGKFVAEQILPEGMHTVEVAVLDADGNGELFLRDLEFRKQDWFYVGMADFTFSQKSVDGPAELLQGENNTQDPLADAHGRVAFFANGKFGSDWHLTTSLDTRDEPVDQMFSNFIDKSPDALFRRIDPDYHYPTFGDDSIVEESAPTSGKLYLKVGHGDDHAMWGNVGIRYDDNELAQVNRGLYGANARYQSAATTSFGERRFAIDAYAAEPGTIPTRQEFRGTGGSLYFLRHQDLLSGSERLRVEMRDRVSGLVTATKELRPAVDYTIDYLQGTVLLSEPLAANGQSSLLVRDGAVSGDEAFLIVSYEFTPGFDELDALSTGGQGHYWITDHIQVGATTSINELDGSDSSLLASNLTLRQSADTWFKMQSARSEGQLTGTLYSQDGGFAFQGLSTSTFAQVDAGASRADLSVGLGDLFEGGRGRVTLYAQQIDAGYSAPGQAVLTDTEHFGGAVALPLTDDLDIHARSDQRDQDRGVSHAQHELNLDYRINDQWRLSSGLRQDELDNDAATALPALDVGERTDAIIEVGYSAAASWDGYVFVQETIAKSETRASNSRYGVGGSYQLNEKVKLEGEISGGDLGLGGKAGTSYAVTEQTSMYLNYALENERTDNVLLTRRGKQGSLVGGMKTRLSDHASVYTEHRYRDGYALTGLTHASGVNLTPAPNWNLGLSSDIGTLRDRTTGAETERRAVGMQASYKVGAIYLSTGIEFRKDVNEQLDLTSSTRETWLYRSSFKVDTSPSMRLLGKFNHAVSDSSLGQFFDGGFTEATVGYAYRPIYHDRLNALVKYTYFYNVPTTDQVTLKNAPAEYIQKSHIVAADLTYDLNSRWSVGGKYAHRIGAISIDREDTRFFDNAAQLYVLRTDYRLLENWEVLVEARQLDMPDLGDSRSGALVALSRYLGEHFKLGLGYNFTDFSDDLTDLSFEHRGAFLNITGML